MRDVKIRKLMIGDPFQLPIAPVTAADLGVTNLGVGDDGRTVYAAALRGYIRAGDERKFLGMMERSSVDGTTPAILIDSLAVIPGLPSESGDLVDDLAPFERI